MNPREIENALTPILGVDIARNLAAIASTHKVGAAGNVSVPSWVLVKIAESFVEQVRNAKS